MVTMLPSHHVRPADVPPSGRNSMGRPADGFIAMYRDLLNSGEALRQVLTF